MPLPRCPARCWRSTASPGPFRSRCTRPFTPARPRPGSLPRRHSSRRPNAISAAWPDKRPLWTNLVGVEIGDGVEGLLRLPRHVRVCASGAVGVPEARLVLREIAEAVAVAFHEAVTG